MNRTEILFTIASIAAHCADNRDMNGNVDWDYVEADLRNIARRTDLDTVTDEDVDAILEALVSRDWSDTELLTEEQVDDEIREALRAARS